MSATEAILDTDTLSAVLRGDGVATTHARTYLARYGRFHISVISRYEVLRGLLARKSAARATAFDAFCARNVVVPLTDDAARRAAAIYGSLHVRGEIIGDADILIAATALEADLVLVTNNVEHFRRVAGLRLDNWIR